MSFRNAQVIVFDLDGTLYEDTHHFDYYAKLVERLLPTDQQAEFAAQYEAALRNEHAVKMGRVYDAKRDLMLVQLDGEVVEAYRWDGTPLSEDSIAELYPEPITLDLMDMVSIGDIWWIPPVIARHMGIPPEKSYEMFEETRRWMMGPEFVMEPIPELDTVMKQLSKRKKLVLLTNSPEPDSEALIGKLGLAELFDHKIFMGMKPIQSQQHMKELAERYDCSYDEILSIGDNWVNDINPPRQLGCQTIYIDPFHIGPPESADAVVSSMGEAIKILKTI